MNDRLYAAYASDLNIEQMQHKCPTAKPIAKSWLFDHRLTFQGSPRRAHATVLPALGQAVPVVIWEISAQDEAALDRYEGVSQGYYTKKNMTLEVDGEMQDVLMYIMRPCDFNLPSRQYLDIVTRGYIDFNLPTTTLEEGLAYAYEGTIVFQNHKEEVHHGIQ